jgi:predicted RNA-binding protein associated with RNAse of E/G family
VNFAKACVLTPTRTEARVVQHKGQAVLVTRLGGRWAAFDPQTGEVLVTGRTRESVASFAFDVIELRREV